MFRLVILILLIQSQIKVTHLAQPFKTLQRALLESARFSYQKGNSNDDVEKTTILLMPGAHTVDNSPGFVCIQ
jgi:hypothetical protein